jgi:hypothetical protein
MKIFDVDFQDIIRTLIRFFKNPLSVMRDMPEWDWKTIIVVQLFIGLTSSLFSSLTNHSIWKILQIVLIFLPVSLFTDGLITLFLYWAFLFLTQQSLPPKDIFTLVIFSTIPFFIFLTFSSFFTPAPIIGIFFSCLLLVVGLVERFALPRNLVAKVVGVVLLLFFIIWLLSQADSYRIARSF